MNMFDLKINSKKYGPCVSKTWRVWIISITTFMLSSFTVHAQGALFAQGKFTLTAGVYEVTISAANAYTIHSIKFENSLLGAPTGYYGTVIAPESGKYIGSGHKEGGVEKVKNIELKVNGTRVIPKAGKKYTGGSITLKKISVLDKLRFETTIELSPEGLVESKKYEALSNQKIHIFAIYAYGWNISTKEWIAKLPDGSMMEGLFKDDGGWHIQKEIKWAALYDPDAGKGMIMFHPRVIPGIGRKTAFWDVGKRYHKYDVFLKTTPVIPKGEKSDTYVLIVKGFSAPSTAWKKEAMKTAGKLKGQD